MTSFLCKVTSILSQISVAKLSIFKWNGIYGCQSTATKGHTCFQLLLTLKPGEVATQGEYRPGPWVRTALGVCVQYTRSRAYLWSREA
jgi:hypothetical protein